MNQKVHPTSVGRICSSDLVSIDVGDSLAEAAERMTYKRVGALAVMDRGSLVGIISEADLMGAIVERAPMQATCVREYMTDAPITVSVNDDADLAARYMLETETGHFPGMESSEAVATLSRRALLAVGAVPEPHRGGPEDD